MATASVLLVGDVHGDTAWWTSTVIPSAKEYEVDAIVQLGDFGYWEHTLSGVKYLHHLNRALGEAGLDLYFCDGNHENHDWLSRIYVGRGADRLLPTPIRDRIIYLPRGCLLTINSTRFLAAGGAWSVDKPMRDEVMARGEPACWWPQETLTDLDVRTCASRGKADVVLSHDAPFRYPIGMEIPHSATKHDYPETTANRDRLTKIVLAARPKLAVHGHWHVFMDTAHPLRDPTLAPDPNDVPPMVRIVGLDCQRRPYNMALLELPSLDITPLR